MGKLSTNSADNSPVNEPPASDTRERADIENARAQKANEADTRHGQAGAESKPFAEPNASTAAAHRPGDSETPADEPNDMISGRRNAGRDDASDAAGRPPERDV